MKSALFFSLCLLPFVCADQLRLFHRVYHPQLAEIPFAHRGVLNVDGNHVSVTSSESFSQHFLHFAEVIHAARDVEGVLYQVALERPGDATEGKWDISSVKACHLHQASSESLFLHTNDTLNATPFAIDYFVSPVPHDGSCPKSKPKPASESAFRSFARNMAGLNTEVVIKATSFPPLPELRTPPPLTPEGAPVVPVPEKSFIEKYWMYAIAILVALMFSGGTPEEQPEK